MLSFHRVLLIAGLTLIGTAPVASAATSTDALQQVVDSRSAEYRARDGARHPVETLIFFTVEPGMTVAEALPGGGWYSRILAEYLGPDGTLYGVNYVDRMWSLFGFLSEEKIAERISASGQFSGQVKKFTDNGIKASGFTFNTVPPAATGTVDRVLLIRALHNLNRFEAKNGMRSQALTAIRGMLKEDGLVGVVQHRAAEDADDAGADGSRGYLKQSAVIAMFEQAGFELVATSEINANPKDQPGPADIVWRLPPTFNDSNDNPERKAAMLAIGESDRMTLIFRKAR